MPTQKNREQHVFRMRCARWCSIQIHARAPEQFPKIERRTIDVAFVRLSDWYLYVEASVCVCVKVRRDPKEIRASSRLSHTHETLHSRPDVNRIVCWLSLNVCVECGEHDYSKKKIRVRSGSYRDQGSDAPKFPEQHIAAQTGLLVHFNRIGKHISRSDRLPRSAHIHMHAQGCVTAINLGLKQSRLTNMTWACKVCAH